VRCRHAQTVNRRATIALYAAAFGVAALYACSQAPTFRAEVVRIARRWKAKAEHCAGCERRREALGRMFSQAHEAVNWGRTLGATSEP